MKALCQKVDCKVRWGKKETIDGVPSVAAAESEGENYKS